MYSSSLNRFKDMGRWASIVSNVNPYRARELFKEIDNAIRIEYLPEGSTFRVRDFAIFEDEDGERTLVAYDEEERRYLFATSELIVSLFYSLSKNSQQSINFISFHSFVMKLFEFHVYVEMV